MHVRIQDHLTIKNRLNQLTEQASSGYVSNTYAGLGAGAAASLNLAPEIAAQQTWQNNINAATGPMTATQGAMSQIGQIASNFYAQLNNLNGLNPSEVDSIAADARDALQQVAGLLDTQVGGNYVFAGQDTGNPPVPNPNSILSSGFATQIAAAVGGLATNGAAATASATLATASSNAAGTSPFSAYLSQPATALARPTVEIGQGQREPVGLLASANADVISTGTSTTGSYTRDLMRALATIGSLSSSQVGATGFGALVQDTQASLGGAITAMSTDAGVLGDRQTALAQTQTTLASVTTALQGQLSDAQDVDTAKTLTDLSQTQTQLQASYQLIAQIKGLTLSAYISTATG